jgi:hypothetical protein
MNLLASCLMYNGTQSILKKGMETVSKASDCRTAVQLPLGEIGRAENIDVYGVQCTSQPGMGKGVKC